MEYCNTKMVEETDFVYNLELTVISKQLGSNEKNIQIFELFILYFRFHKHLYTKLCSFWCFEASEIIYNTLL